MVIPHAEPSEEDGKDRDQFLETLVGPFFAIEVVVLGDEKRMANAE